jgi:hypothetical protein
MEGWAWIPEFPLYQVSTHGQVRRGEDGHPVGVHLNQQDVAYVSLMRDDEQFHRGLARLVALAFIPKNIDTFDTPINLNGDRRNCDVSNLMWRPRWFAIQYHMQFKRRGISIDVPLRDMESGDVYNNSWDVATTFGLLEKDVVGSVENYTVVWPTYQRFQFAD